MIRLLPTEIQQEIKDIEKDFPEKSYRSTKDDRKLSEARVLKLKALQQQGYGSFTFRHGFMVTGKPWSQSLDEYLDSGAIVFGV